ncbi:MAG: TetR/AcrR family transcriptional regulator C-terminal domain-containing protein [Acidibrevibacterium sp.]|uniref:TetR/AcrR family transcriptional regulator C-terminal domain-containing protein n=1 Tax=Acidibrevibacterium sp. TaxID=2606776 RepID=UPI003D05EBB5
MLAANALSPEKRARILAGAADVFARDGYEGASMSRIAAAANVSKGTLYNHFESKAQLFAAYVEAACARNLCQVFAGSDENTDVVATLERIGRRMIEMMLSDLGLTIYRVVVAEARKFPELASAFYNAGPARAIAEMARWLRARTAAGALAVADPEFAAEQFFCLCQTRLWLRYKLNLQDAPAETGIDDVVKAAVAMFLNTYGVNS